MMKRSLRVFQFVALPLFALPVTVFAQAALEYGLLSGGSSVATSGSFATVAGCKVDAALPTCLNHYYPETTILIAVAIGLIVVLWLSGRARPRARPRARLRTRFRAR